MENENIQVSISVPLKDYDSEAQERLRKLIDSKAELLKKVFETNDLSFKTEDDKLTFEWFKENSLPEEIVTYTKFICMLCDLAKKQKKVNNTVTKVISEKFAFRCFLLKIGMIGKEYKVDRNILLKNLKGSISRNEA